MANLEHLDILKKGPDVWNEWRRQHPEEICDLSEANLRETNLTKANLSEARLYRANLIEVSLSGAILEGARLNGAILYRSDLSGAILEGANLYKAVLNGARLNDANLREADLREADLSGAILYRSDLSGARLNGAILSRTDLREADLSGARLNRANLSRAYLSEANLKGASVEWTTFIDIDLRTVKGLETIEHKGPSGIGIDTLFRSQGRIPEIFLRQAGVPEDFLAYLPSLVNSALEYYTCFVSYASQNEDFAQRLYADLQVNGVRCWFAPEDIKIGDKIRQRIDESIRLYDKLLLVLSEQSVKSAWVEYEVEAALAKERRESRTVLFPIRLDSEVMKSTTAWAAHIKDTRHIGNFTQWKDHDAYQHALQRLLRDLRQKDK